MIKKAQQKNSRGPPTEEELERIERAAARWKAMGNPIGLLAERCLIIYRDNYHPDSALNSVGQDVKTVSSARELARRVLASQQPFVDGFAKARRRDHRSVAESYGLSAVRYGLNSETFSHWLNAALGASGGEEPFHEGLRLVAAYFMERDIPLPPPYDPT